MHLVLAEDLARSLVRERQAEAATADPRRPPRHRPPPRAACRRGRRARPPAPPRAAARQQRPRPAPRPRRGPVGRGAAARLRCRRAAADRDLAPSSPRRRRPRPGAGLRERALAVLLDPALAHVVALVAWRDGDRVRRRRRRGRSALGRDGSAEVLVGRDPVADQDPFSDADTCYPLAAVRLHGLFDEPRAPDLAVVHTGAHHCRDHGRPPRRARLPQRAAVPGPAAAVRARGWRRAGSSTRCCRTVDVGATLAAPRRRRPSGMDGVPLDLAVPGARPRRRAALGRRALGRAAGAGRRRRPCPHVAPAARARLRAARRGGRRVPERHARQPHLRADRPGPGPPRHRQQRLLRPGGAASRSSRTATPPGTARWSTCARACAPCGSGCRRARRRPASTSPATPARTTRRSRSSATAARRQHRLAAGVAAGGGATTRTPRTTTPAQSDYAWGTQIDAIGLEQVLGLWREGEPPPLTWWNTTLTDGAHHAAGPGTPMARASLRDADRRLGVCLDLVDARGLHRRRHRAAHRRPRHAGQRPRRAPATGTRRCARPGSRSATRPTASSTSATTSRRRPSRDTCPPRPRRLSGGRRGSRHRGRRAGSSGQAWRG